MINDIDVLILLYLHLRKKDIRFNVLSISTAVVDVLVWLCLPVKGGRRSQFFP